MSQIKKDIPLQTYFNRAYKDALTKHQLGDQPADDSTDKLHVPMTLIAYDKSGRNVHSRVGIYQDEMHFSASLLKAGVMYAAYKLLAEAEALAASPPTGGFKDQKGFFAVLQKQFNSSDAVPEITKVGATAGLVPRYADILKVEGFGGELKVTFVPEFFRSVPEDRELYNAYLRIRHDQRLGKDADGNKIENADSRAALAAVSHMYKMIVWSNNTSAGECIRRLGYAYINVKLMEKDLFDKEHTKGIWIGGDYVGVAPRIEVDSVNDDKVATATTTRHMAELFSLIKLEELPHSDKMQLLISEAQVSEPSFISRAPSRLFQVGGVKIGVANIKPNTKPLGPDVSSEGIIFSWKTDDALEGEKLPKDRGLSDIFAVCWQNVRGDAIAADKPAHNVRSIDDAEYDGVAEVIQNTIKNFLNQTALP
jgi:hypothetical protein